MRERVENICSKRFSTCEGSPVPSKTLVKGTESGLQPAETSTVVVRTPASEGSTDNDSSDGQFKDEDYTFIYEEAQSIPREWRQG